MKKTRRNLILKARRKGLTKIIDADQLVDCIRQYTNAVVISHEKKATERLFFTVKEYINNLEVKPFVSNDSTGELKFPKRGSSYFIGTAGQRAFGRGDDIHRAHLSEAAFYFDLEKILGGISEAAEYGQIDIESTPNGRDKFYDMCQKAKTGKSPYTLIFIPWYIDDEYSVDSLNQEEITGLSKSVKEMFLIPDKEFMQYISDEERLLVGRVKQEYGIELTAGQLKWRQYKIWDKGDLFWQEYPEDDVSCFLQSGRSVFNKITTDITKRIPLDNFERWGTEEERLALKARTLYAAVDGAEGVEDGDRHVFSVIDAPADNPQATIIYEYASNEPIDVFWLKITPIIKAFKMQFAIERNGVGVAHVEKAKALGLRFTEWWTGENRPQMITELEEAYRKEDLIETYPEAEDEARAMLYLKSNNAEAPKGKHDDRVLSRSIAWQMRKKPRPRLISL